MLRSHQARAVFPGKTRKCGFLKLSGNFGGPDMRINFVPHVSFLKFALIKTTYLTWVEFLGWNMIYCFITCIDSKEEGSVTCFRTFRQAVEPYYRPILHLNVTFQPHSMDCLVRYHHPIVFF